MNKSVYKQLNDRIEPSEALIQRTLRAARPRPAFFAPRRVVAFALALTLCLGLGTSALAAASTSFNGWLYTLSPNWAMYFRPVQMSCEDQGLQLKVQGIRITGRTAEVYVTLQDLTGDRLDASIDLFDSYSLDTPGGSSAYCQMTGYDAATRTATFYIHYESDSPIRSDKLTFSLRRLLTKKETTTASIDLALGSLSADPETHLPGNRIRGWGGSSKESYDSVSQQLLLLPGEDMAVPVPGVALAAAGFLNDKLHAQIRYEDITRTDNHGFLWLEDAQGHRIDSIASVAYWAENKSDSFEEYFFDVSPETAQECTLHGEFITCHSLIEGDWQITFPLADL